MSISLTEEDRVVLAARAKQAYGNNLSAVIHDLVETLRRELAMDALLEELGADRIPTAMLEELRREIEGGAKVVKPRRPSRRRAA